MQATAVVPLPMKGSRITPPLTAVLNQPADDAERLHRRVMVPHVVLLVAQRDVVSALGVIRAVEPDALLAKEQDIFGIVQILVAAGGYRIHLVPAEQVPVAAPALDKIVQVLPYLPLTAENIEVDLLHHAAHLVEHLVRYAILDVAQPLHTFPSATGIIPLGLRVLALRPESPALVLQLIRRVGNDTVHRSIRNPLHTHQAVFVVDLVYCHTHICNSRYATVP